MDTPVPQSINERYAKCIAVSKQVRWDIDRHVIRGREFDMSRKFLPDRLSQIEQFGIADPAERRLVSQIQGRTYANMFGMFERFIAAKLLDLTRGHALGNQVVLESLVRFTDEELKHQELFQRLEEMMAKAMPRGYAFLPHPDAVATAVLGKCTWAVLALACHVELFTLDHYRQSIDHDFESCDLWKDVFLFHMKEESQHAILDELEWRREDGKLSAAQREAAVNDLIGLFGGVDALLRVQATADADYFAAVVRPRPEDDEAERIERAFLRAYRWQYIASGIQNQRFMAILTSLVHEQQMRRITTAIAPILEQPVLA